MSCLLVDQCLNGLFEFRVHFAMETMWNDSQDNNRSIALIVLRWLSDCGSTFTPWPAQSATIKTISNENTHSLVCSDMNPAVFEIWFLAVLPKLKLTLPQFNGRCYLAFSLFFWTPHDSPLIHYMVTVHPKDLTQSDIYRSGSTRNIKVVFPCESHLLPKGPPHGKATLTKLALVSNLVVLSMYH